MAGCDNAPSHHSGPFSSLCQPLFRHIWIASLFSNLGQLVQGVAAAWAMTQLTTRATAIALN